MYAIKLKSDHLGTKAQSTFSQDIPPHRDNKKSAKQLNERRILIQKHTSLWAQTHINL